MISTITLNPALDKNIYIDKLRPNDTNRVSKVETDAGGKGISASRILRELGAETLALGFIGGDAGSYIQHVLSREGVQTDFVLVDSSTRTNIAVQEATGAPPTTFNEAGPQVAEDDFDELFAKVRRAARRSSMMLFGGSLPPGAPVDTYKRLVSTVQEMGVNTVLDSDGEPMCQGLEASPYMIKPNREETRRLVGVEIKSLEDAAHATELFRRFGIQVIVISMGADGAVGRYGDEIWHAQPPSVEVVSTVGSGDSMVAGISHILSQGGTLEEALRWGTAAGAATAMTDGTEIGRRPNILALLDKVQLKRL